MKKLLALILTIALLSGCAPAVYEGPTESVWVLSEMHTTHYPNEYFDGSTSDITFVYDSFGNKVRTCHYEDGELIAEYRRTYDDRGNCIRSVTWDHLGPVSFPRARTHYTYDEKNRMLSYTARNFFFLKTSGSTCTYDDAENSVHWEGPYDTQTNYLNENGDPVRSVTHSRAAGIDLETIYEYDGLGRNTKITEYQNGVLSSITESRYDDLGRILDSAFYDAAGTLLRRTTCLYEDDTTTTTDTDGSKTVVYLRPDGQIEIQEQYNTNGELTTRTEYIYTEIQIPAKEE